MVLSPSLKTVKAGRGGACVSHGTLKAEAGGSLEFKARLVLNQGCIMRPCFSEMRSIFL